MITDVLPGYKSRRFFSFVFMDHANFISVLLDKQRCCEAPVPDIHVDFFIIYFFFVVENLVMSKGMC